MTNLTNGLTPGAIAELFAKTKPEDVTFTMEPVTTQMPIRVLDVRVIEGEDWGGMWVDDVLVYQNHTVDLHDIQRHVGARPMWFELVYASDELNRWLFDNGRFNESDSFSEALTRVEE